MNYKKILVSVFLTFACSSAVFAQDQYAEICKNPSNEQTRVLCEKITQLQGKNSHIAAEPEQSSALVKLQNYVSHYGHKLGNGVNEYGPYVVGGAIGLTIGHMAYENDALGYLVAAGVPTALITYFILMPTADLMTSLVKGFYSRY